MTIEIHEPQVEALIKDRIESGAFRDAEDVVVQAVLSAPSAALKNQRDAPRTGADIIAAFQACPYPDFMPEPEKIYMPVRDVEL